MLKVSHLSVKNSWNGGLTDISLTVQTGEIVAVIGPSGSGKTLLGRAIADPDIRFDGEIIVNHFNARTERDQVKRQIGYAAADDHNEGYVTGFEYLELVGSFCYLSSSVRQTRILALAKQFDCLNDLYTLNERQHSAVSQKIRLIASLLAEPPLIIWDEPTRYLDEFGHAQATAALDTAVKNGAAAVIITSDLSLAEAIADRLVLIKEGRLLTEGTAAQVEQLAGTHRRGLAAAFRQLLSP